ncbi:hypothetical protein B296_00042751 [Ensete ventricosum]|uniref:Uncharacterized protein n=1 Tax=Ensete ventricosum TaxID=4639 RepID=A0A426XAU6_ENSVE|nr:hypothetical protein B296_00042751 [Ensete ventricosum]
MRRRLASRRGRTTPRSLAGRRCGASFPSWKTRRRLVTARGDKASPHSRAVASGPCTDILSDRYIPPVPGNID